MFLTPRPLAPSPPSRILASPRLPAPSPSRPLAPLDRAVHTFEVFRWAWMTIQARAFGRRLPWTALVPFADTLNHGNYQTKYDKDIGGIHYIFSVAKMYT